MNYYAVYLKMKDIDKNKQFRQEHLNFLQEKYAQEQVVMFGPFTDGSGGMVIYQGDNKEEVTKIATQDPYVIKGAREMEVKEWDMKS